MSVGGSTRDHTGYMKVEEIFLTKYPPWTMVASVSAKNVPFEINSAPDAYVEVCNKNAVGKGGERGEG